MMTQLRSRFGNWLSVPSLPLQAVPLQVLYSARAEEIGLNVPNVTLI